MNEPKVPDWPKPGERYVWEMAKPHAAKGLIVTKLEWNGESWFVLSEGLTACNTPDGKISLNSLERFQEACWEFRHYEEPSWVWSE